MYHSYLDITTKLEDGSYQIKHGSECTFSSHVLKHVRDWTLLHVRIEERDILWAREVMRRFGANYRAFRANGSNLASWAVGPVTAAGEMLGE
jgi:hypothetical protein